MIEGIEVAAVGLFAADRRVWRSFDHLVAWSGQALLMVPVGLVRGNLLTVVDGLPVPWGEVLAVLRAEGTGAHAVTREALGGLCTALPLAFGPDGWVVDTVPPGPNVPTLTRAVSPDGVRWAKVRGRSRG
jgi:hypothetical protein